MLSLDSTVLGFGSVNLITLNAGKGDFMSLGSGQSTALSRALPAAELVANLAAETDEAMDRLA